VAGCARPKDRERCVPETDGPLGATALWEKLKPAVRTEWKQTGVWLAAGMARLKCAVAEIAATKSSQQIGREEEKE